LNLPSALRRFHRETALLPSSALSTMLISFRRRLVPFFALGAPLALGAQVIDLTVRDAGIAIGDKPRMTGLRISFRDRELRQVNGVGAGAFGVGVDHRLRGIAIGGIGVGTGQELRGIAIGGVGVGSGVSVV